MSWIISRTCAVLMLAPLAADAQGMITTVAGGFVPNNVPAVSTSGVALFPFV
jgi:hypothetical protein